MNTEKNILIDNLNKLRMRLIELIKRLRTDKDELQSLINSTQEILTEIEQENQDDPRLTKGYIVLEKLKQEQKGCLDRTNQALSTYNQVDVQLEEFVFKYQ